MAQLLFQKDEKVLCFHGPLIYEAKILKAEYWEEAIYGSLQKGAHYFVHYKGWKQTWDEWVPENRIMKLTESNLQKQKNLYAQHSKAANATNGHGPSGGNTSTSTGNSTTSTSGNKKSKGSNHNPNAVNTTTTAALEDKEENYINRPEIKIDIPDPLKALLIDDWEAITKDQKLVSIPRSPNVHEILSEYKQQHVTSSKKELDILEETLQGLELYFDKALGRILLYRYERPQYADILESQANNNGEIVPMSKLYGAEHLLRLFVQLPMMVAHSMMDKKSVSILKKTIESICNFLCENSTRFFLQEYDNAPPEYTNAVNT